MILFKSWGVLGYSWNHEMEESGMTKTHQMVEIFVSRWWHVRLGEGIKTEVRDILNFEGIGTMAGKGRWLHQQGQKPPKSIVIGRIVLAYSHDRT